MTFHTEQIKDNRCLKKPYRENGHTSNLVNDVT